MKNETLQKKSDKDLVKLLAEKREDFRTFRFDMTGSKTRDVKDARNIKKDIARVLTEINRRVHNA